MSRAAPDEETLFMEAQFFELDNKHREALAVYDQIISANPHSFRAYVNRANCKQSLNDHAGAIEDCTRALSLKDDVIKVFHLRAYSKLNSGDAAGAVADYNRVLDRDPSLVSAYEDLVCAYLQRATAKSLLKDSAGDAKDCLSALALKPDMPDILYHLACLKMNSKKYDEAIEILLGLKRLDPTDATLPLPLSQAHTARGILNFGRKDYTAAIADFEAALALNSDAMKARHIPEFQAALALGSNAIKALHIQGNLALTKSVVKDKLAQSYHQRGIEKASAGQYPEALEDFKSALKLTPEFEIMLAVIASQVSVSEEMEASKKKSAPREDARALSPSRSSSSLLPPPPSTAAAAGGGAGKADEAAAPGVVPKP